MDAWYAVSRLRIVVQPIALEEFRLLSRAKVGEPAALAAVWRNWRNAIWSICLAMARDREHALSLLKTLYGELRSVIRGWTTDTTPCCLVATWIFRRLHALLELPDLQSIDAPAPRAVSVPGHQQVAARVARLSPGLRLVYLIDLFFGCPAQKTAAILGVDEVALRHARAIAAWDLVKEDEP